MSLSRPWWILLIVATALFAVLIVGAERMTLRLRDPAQLTGYLLLGTMIGLALFNLRKRLAVLPLGRAYFWTLLHVTGGLLAVGLFWRHAETVWPTGAYERILAALFYLVSLSGIVGYLLQKIYPRRLTQTGIEIIYERIPAEIAALRERAEEIVLECTEKTGCDTLARHYVETLDWFFRRPRFQWSHAFGGDAGVHWARNQLEAVRRYLNEDERGYLDALAGLAEVKTKIDFHYVAQRIMKGWLLVHLPLAAAVMVVALWHLVLVNAYAL